MKFADLGHRLFLVFRIIVYHISIELIYSPLQLRDNLMHLHRWKLKQISYAMKCNTKNITHYIIFLKIHN